MGLIGGSKERLVGIEPPRGCRRSLGVGVPTGTAIGVHETAVGVARGGNLDQALTAFAPGASEHAGHPHATDGIERWRLGKPNLLSTSDPVIEDGPVQTLLLEPAR